jgi:uncharacterized protein YqjF (DUF2071 family)
MKPAETAGVPDTAARLLARSPNGRRPLIMNHRWENLLFLHWRMPPVRIQETLPAGLTVDTFEGEAYLGITPFFMRDIRLSGIPALPWFSFFQELNVRTYVYANDGTPGVWFYSLDCNRAWAVLGARMLAALPYFAAKMSARRGDWIEYLCQRRGASETARYRYRSAGEPRDPRPETLEFFLIERYYLFARRGNGSLLRGQVEHPPYQYRNAEVAEFSTVPAKWDGFTDLATKPDHVCFVDGLNVNIYAPERI